MQPPSLLVQPIYSGVGLSPANKLCAWGKVVQVNPETLPYNVGNVVFYNPENIPLLYSPDTNQYYNIINESKVLFVEGGILPK